MTTPKTLFCCLLSLGLGLLTACGGGDDEKKLLPPELQTGTIEMTIPSLPAGTGTAHRPVVVGAGDSLCLSIHQRSSYTDLDGSVFTCTPMAEIRLKATSDTVFATDLASLTRVGAPRQTSSVEGEEPARHATAQVFAIGAQQVCFNLSHEVYNYTNRAGQVIEMPYVMPSPATLGEALPAEARAQRPVVRLRRVDVARSVTLTDTTVYDVTASFSLTLESVHTDEAADAPELSFEVSYTGVVTQEVTYPDPVQALTYTIDGTTPYTATHAAPLSLSIAETPTYTTSFGDVYKNTLEASIDVTVEGDTVKGAKASDFSVTNPKVEVTNTETEHTKSSQHNFKLGDLTVNFKLKYQTPEIPNDAEEEYMKVTGYLKVATVDFVKIESIKKVSSSPEKYRIKARFDVGAESVGVSEPETKKIPIYVEYDGIIKEPELIKVIYRQGYDWDEPHDNLTWRYKFFVYRDRYYDNGDTITDTFSTMWFMSWIIDRTCIYSTPVPYEREPITNGQSELVMHDGKKVSASIRLIDGNFDGTDHCEFYGEVGIDNFNWFNWIVVNEYFDFDKLGGGPTYLLNDEDYKLLESIPNELNVPVAPKEPSEQGFKETDLPNGWYWCTVWVYPLPESIFCWYLGDDKMDMNEKIFNAYQNYAFAMVYLVIDNKIIKFDEWMPKEQASWEIKPYTQPFSKAKPGTEVRVGEYNSSVTHLGHKFWARSQWVMYIKP